MFLALAQAVQMAFQVPAQEKNQALKASEAFNEVINSLKIAKDYLDVIYEPFKRSQTIDSEKAKQKQGMFNRIKSKIKINYGSNDADEKTGFNQYAIAALKEFSFFENDPTTAELIESFKTAALNLGKQVEILLGVLDDVGAVDFKDKIIMAIDNIKSLSSQLESLIKDRIISHINDNIIAKDWANESSESGSLESKEPEIIKLYKERQKVLNQYNSGIDIQKNPQLLNPGNAQQMYYPTDRRQMVTEPENSFKHWE